MNSGTEPIRILRLITRLNAGGPARHVVWLAEGLASRGYETRLVTGEVSPEEDDLSSFARQKGVEPRSLSDLTREIDRRSDARSLRELTSIIDEFRPHIVHTHTSKAGLLGRWATRRVNRKRRSASERPIRIFHTFHGNVLSGYFSPPKTWLFRSIERYLGRHVTDRLIVLSEQQREEIVLRFRIAPPERVSVVPLALDLTEFESSVPSGALRREQGLSREDFVVGIVGRIAPIKNHPMFLQAAARVAKELPTARFVVVGGGAGMHDLVRLAANLGIAERVRFSGVRTDLPAIYADLDAVALTSLNEGTPLSLIEAMAAGKPIVATDVGGVRDLLTREWVGEVNNREFLDSREGRGILVGARDVEGCAAALIRLGKDPDLARKVGAAGREYAFRFHALPRLVQDLDKLYRETLER